MWSIAHSLDMAMTMRSSRKPSQWLQHRVHTSVEGAGGQGIVKWQSVVLIGYPLNGHLDMKVHIIQVYSAELVTGPNQLQ